MIDLECSRCCPSSTKNEVTTGIGLDEGAGEDDAAGGVGAGGDAREVAGEDVVARVAAVAVLVGPPLTEGLARVGAGVLGLTHREGAKSLRQRRGRGTSEHVRAPTPQDDLFSSGQGQARGVDVAAAEVAR